MKRSAATGVDQRGFRWPLVALERRRSLVLDEQVLRLSGAERVRSALQAELERATASHAEQIGAMGELPGTTIHPGLRREALAYLTGANARMQAVRDALARAEVQHAAAQLCVQRAGRDLEVVGRLRAAALSEFAMHQRRMHAKEADLAWLAHRFARGAAR